MQKLHHHSHLPVQCFNMQILMTHLNQATSNPWYLRLPRLKSHVLCTVPSDKTSNMLDYNFHISTSRLTLSYLDPNNEQHVDFIYELNNSPEMLHVYRNMPRVIDTRASARKHIEQGVETLERIGYGRFLVSRNPNDPANPSGDDERLHSFSDAIKTHDIVGILSMQKSRFPSAPNIPDIGFAIMAKYHGNGYATEAAQGLIKYYREEKGQAAFAGYCGLDNQNSIKMFRRLGFEERGVKEVNGVIGDEVYLKCLVFTTGIEGDLDGIRDVSK
jgi:RimJ/RimL family protein N-acetyltransferase